VVCGQSGEPNLNDGTQQTTGWAFAADEPVASKAVATTADLSRHHSDAKRRLRELSVFPSGGKRLKIA